MSRFYPIAGVSVVLTTGASADLYGWERVRAKPCRILICEGEFDRLVLESNGLSAARSPGWQAPRGPADRRHAPTVLAAGGGCEGLWWARAAPQTHPAPRGRMRHPPRHCAAQPGLIDDALRALAEPYRLRRDREDGWEEFKSRNSYCQTDPLPTFMLTARTRRRMVKIRTRFVWVRGSADREWLQIGARPEPNLGEGRTHD